MAPSRVSNQDGDLSNVSIDSFDESLTKDPFADRFRVCAAVEVEKRSKVDLWSIRSVLI